MLEYGKIINVTQLQLGMTYEEAVENLAKALFIMVDDSILKRYLRMENLAYHDPDNNRDCYMGECACWGILINKDKENNNG
jgi:hypothetical protein